MHRYIPNEKVITQLADKSLKIHINISLAFYENDLPLFESMRCKIALSYQVLTKPQQG